MKYNKIVKGIFLSRPNRFIAHVLIEAEPHVVHVKNTGRCKELLIEGVTVYLEDFGIESKGRKTRYSIIAVEKTILREGKEKVILVNMDSQATNKAIGEALASRDLQLPEIKYDLSLIKPEKTFGDSRFDFYIEAESQEKIEPLDFNRQEHERDATKQRAYIEVKGCTLEENGVVRFPDAPTERGVKHIRELCKAVEQGYLAYAIFVIQMKDVYEFRPNDDTHPEFGIALREAKKQGVHVLAYDCVVTKNSMVIGESVEVKL